jgi:lysophospholipase L1-like esterase
MTAALAGAATIDWVTASDSRFDVRGLPWFAENQGEFIRLPKRLKDELPPPVWNLGLSPAGARIRFRTDSTRVAIRLDYPSPPNMANMHAFGQTGVDLYLDGIYRSTAVAPKDAAAGKIVEHVFAEDLPKAERELTLYLPLYKPVTPVAIGLDPGSSIKPARRYVNAKPVVYYGTSITQGGCASRSGMSYQAILSRQLALDFVNLGFSGNGKGEPAVAAMVAEIDAAAFVLDFARNNPTVESVREVYAPFLDKLRQKHPGTPIIAITPIAAAGNPRVHEEMREHIRQVVKTRIAAGDTRLTLVEGISLLGPHQLDGLVDGSHPNDLGFQWMADALSPTIAAVLSLPPPRLVDDRQVTITSIPEAEARRAAIVRFIWGDAGFPRSGRPAAVKENDSSPVAGLRNLKRVDTMAIRMSAGEENTTHHFIPKDKANGKLIVLHHGHACTFDDARDSRGGGMADALDMLLGEGYAVLASYMPRMRPGDCRTLPHGKLFDKKLASGNALQFFMEPVAISLNVLKPRYREIHMAGLSGGGWTTTLYAAIDPAIRLSFPVAGSIPLYLRAGGSVGDLEQFLEPFYRLAGYGDLYVLGSIGPRRAQVQILNRKDDCCFGEAQHSLDRATGLDYERSLRVYEQAVREALGSKGSFRLVVDDTAPRHMISPEAARTMIAEMQKP